MDRDDEEGRDKGGRRGGHPSGGEAGGTGHGEEQEWHWVEAGFTLAHDELSLRRSAAPAHAPVQLRREMHAPGFQLRAASVTNFTRFEGLNHSQGSDVGLAAALQRELQAAIAAGLPGVSDIGHCRQGTALECPTPEARQVHAYANTGAFFNMINPTDGGKPTSYVEIV